MPLDCKIRKGLLIALKMLNKKSAKNRLKLIKNKSGKSIV